MNSNLNEIEKQSYRAEAENPAQQVLGWERKQSALQELELKYTQQDDMDAAREEAYEEGQADGYSDGYRDGLNEGYDRGFHEGYTSKLAVPTEEILKKRKSPKRVVV
jgi:flagellar biosynthesis/type III secretory pathway protein FliH